MSCLPYLDQLVGIADAVVRGRARRRDRIADALDLEPGRERRRSGRGHRLRHRERADALRPFGAGDVGGLDDGARRRPARAHDDAGALVGDFGGFEAGIADRLLHGDVVPGGAAAEKAHGAAIDRFARVERRRAVHLGAEAKLGIFVGAHDAGPRFAQRGQDFLGVVADGRDNAHSGDDHPPHLRLVTISFRLRAAARSGARPVCGAASWN